MLSRIVLTLSLLALLSTSASGISSTVIGDQSPLVEVFPGVGSRMNGGFTVTGTGVNETIINGIDEVTEWTFDFSSDPGLERFREAARTNPLAFARLKLELSPRDPLITTDWFEIDGLPQIALPDAINIGSLAPGQVNEVEVDLLDFYSSDEILGSLTFFNTLSMNYGDDAILSLARLDAEVVPEPDSMAVWGLMVIAIAGWSFKKRYFGETAC